MESILKQARDELAGLCNGSKEFRMSIPVLDSDTDVIIDNALALAKKLAETVIEAHQTDNHIDRSRLWSEAKSLSEYLTGTIHKAALMKTDLDFEPGEVAIGTGFKIVART